MQPVLAVFAVAEAVRLVQRAVPGMPQRAVCQLDQQIDGHLADVVQQRGVSNGGGPGFRLRRLVFGAGADGQQMGLPQLERIGDDLQPVIQHAAGVSVMMALGSGELLDQLGVALQRRAVQRGELPARQRRALPDVFQQLLSARCRQQRCGRFGP